MLAMLKCATMTFTEPLFVTLCRHSEKEGTVGILGNLLVALLQLYKSFDRIIIPAWASKIKSKTPYDCTVHDHLYCHSSLSRSVSNQTESSLFSVSQQLKHLELLMAPLQI